ncbi:hypothetical protein SEMRO_279_G106930.1 [Seminavis robusta]|uniref:Uncharacterized protein n=1 Tax=Seminavis robusta TaxID=568900 RepID=A0A9N8DVN1_9STRA|nr:hypothetical protein SEMRO_279_G106930.1 [Seminavis robusta]|eukprot:Sro279_g106930.1 n/a (134) ;mRNA; f:76077-76478
MASPPGGPDYLDVGGYVHTETQRASVSHRTAEFEADGRKDGNKKLYNGYVAEFHSWCKAGRGEIVKGLKTKPTKVVFDTMTTANTALEFVEDNFILRPQLDGKNGYNKEAPHSKRSFENILKGLRDYRFKMKY